MNTENRPIRICFIALRAYPLFNPRIKEVFGGAEVDLYLLATQLSKDKEFEISFVVGDYDQESIEVYEDVVVIKSTDVKRNLFLNSRHIWKALVRANAHIYVSEASSLGTTLNALFCRLHKRKFIYRTASNIECDGTYLQQHRFRGKAFIWSLRHADTVITQNDEVAKKLLATTGIASQVIRNAHILMPLSQKHRDNILWVGRSTTLKVPELFIKLARHLPDEQFTMICQKASGDKNYDNLVAQAETLKNLKFIRNVPFHEIDKYFQQAKVLVNTSSSEGFPNTFIQACKCATPILSLKVNPDAFLDRYNCGLCANGDWGLFVNMLKQLLNSNTACKLGNNGRRYADDNHDIKKIIEEYKALFRKSVKQQNAQGK